MTISRRLAFRAGGIAGLLALTGGALIAGSVLVHAQEAAPPSAGLSQQLADMLDRRSNVSDEARARGQALFKAHCAACHDTGANRAPPTSVLGNLTPDTILRVVTEGVMKEQAASLSNDEKVSVAEALTGHKLGEMAAVKPRMCMGAASWFDLSQPPAMAGWGLDARNGHNIAAKVAGLDKARIGGLKVKWAMAYPSVLYARSQPALAGGALFVAGDDSTVYALDPATGCAHWTFASAGPVRMGVVVGWTAGKAGARPRIYFGDLLGNGYALDAATGKQVWRRKLDNHPNATLTGSPALRDGLLYWPISSLEEPAAAAATHECCTFRGSLAAIDAATGKERWRTWMVEPPKRAGKNARGVQLWGPSGVAIWSTPMIDTKRGQIYVTTGDNYSPPSTKLSDAIVALDLKTGKVRWSHQASDGDIWNVSCGMADVGNCPEDSGPDFDFGAAPVLATGKNGKDYVLAGQKSGAVFALDPATGKLRWTKRLGRGGIVGGVHFGIAASGGTVFVPISDFPDGGKHDLPAHPGLYALDVATGKSIWSAPADDNCGGKRFCGPGYGGAITVAGSMVIAGSTDGHLRIFDAASGKLLRDMDTDQPYTAVNGVKAHGGSMAGGSAPIAWHGMLFVNSGYGFLGKMPGNVLLAFGAE